MQKKLAAIVLVGLSGCSSLPDPEPPVFFLCASNVAAVRTELTGPSDASSIEVVLRAHARREFELLAKRHYGEAIRLAAGESTVGRVKVLLGFRTGRISFFAESISAREAFDLLDPPPESPCGTPR